MKIDPITVSKLMALRNFVENEAATADYSDDYLGSLVSVAVRYKRYEALQKVFDRLGFPTELDLKERITMWQLLENK